MPVCFSVTIATFESQRVKDTAALLVWFRDAVAQDKTRLNRCTRL